MKKNPEFDDIRPYYDDELPEVIDRLTNDSRFKKMIESFLPDMTWEQFSALLHSVRTTHDFQSQLIRKIIFQIMAKPAKSLKCEGFENIKKETAYTYISNHRDIVLDAALLCVCLLEEDYDTVEIAIGDNLLSNQWIEDIVRLNKSFIVKRGVSGRQMLENSIHLSQYIHYTIKEKNQCVWIAQREGRAKNSDDRTQKSVLKMLSMGGAERDFLKNMEELNICPVSFSYEYDPCDFLKAKEFQQKRDDPEFKKSRRDDLLSMETGIFGYKGNVYFRFGKPINELISDVDRQLTKNEQITKIASLIDREIFRNYRFYPINYIAYDRLWGKDLFKECYSVEDITAFDVYLRQQLDKIDLPEKDIPFLTEKMLEMYAYPVKNQLSVKEK